MISSMLTAASALLLVASLAWPAYCYWLVFVFLAPLLYRAVFLPMQYPFVAGLWWGIVFYSGHFIALFMVFHEKAYGSWRYGAPFIFTLYCSIYAALWFLINARIARGKAREVQLIGWGMGAWFYFYAVSHYMLWPSGQLTGYCFGSPLLPLAQNPKYLYAIKIVSVDTLLAFLIGLQVFGLIYYFTKSKKYLSVLGICIMPFGAWLVIDTIHEIPPDYLATVCYAYPPARSITHPMEQAEEITINILKARQSKPNATCILMPESSFTHDLNVFPEVIAMWNANCLEPYHTLFLGSYRSEKQCEYNSLFMIKDCRITKCYDKSFLMPFVEYLPNFCKEITWIRNLFLKNINEFLPKKNFCGDVTLSKNLTVSPQICSDIYMTRLATCSLSDNQSPILFAVNDSWFSMTYAQQLMFLYAKYYAMACKRDVLYIGHTFGCWISHATGKTILL